MAAVGERVVIKGSERVTNWERESGSVWRATVPHSAFGEFNPFAEEVYGDWLFEPSGPPRRHLGDVYLNGVSLYEVGTLEELQEPLRRTEVIDYRTGLSVPVFEPERTLLVWHSEVGDDETVIWANFQEADPNQALIEINVRPSVFSPLAHHLDFITVRGFELAQAATPWAPPTANQVGLIGPNWAKGWVIEDNMIHDAKCSGISLGKEMSTGENFWTERGDKPGYQYQLESVFAARQIGWDREHIGSHLVRRNTIFECGQAGIVGHLGCVFSTIEDNHISRIALKREFYGAEIAGIKLHAAIDVEIRHNRIHDCSLGIWLDWQAQGTRVSRNVLYENVRDLFVEVSHGPYLVEHNIFASPFALETASQGGAYVHNLVGGCTRLVPTLDRPTPYHVPHSTEVAGYAAIYGGDDRYIANIFLGGRLPREPRGNDQFPVGYGTAAYDGSPPTFEDYLSRLAAQEAIELPRYRAVRQPAYLRANVYGAGAEAFADEDAALLLEADPSFTVVDRGAEVYLEVDLPERFATSRVGVVSSSDLPRVRFVDAEFEDRDGGPVVLDVDLLGSSKQVGECYPAGPLANLGAGTSRVRIW
ncbi:MAG: right-handed parallel beta-helix repeat-containing protein [Actinomycetota bacterium]|nr:right-handed parallel beta-helix repeat-containing protein [Actinomycetota bacterium]